MGPVLVPAPDVSSECQGPGLDVTRGKRFDVLWIRDRRDLPSLARCARMGAALVMQRPCKSRGQKSALALAALPPRGRLGLWASSPQSRVFGRTQLTRRAATCCLCRWMTGGLPPPKSAAPSETPLNCPRHLVVGDGGTAGPQRDSDRPPSPRPPPEYALALCGRQHGRQRRDERAALFEHAESLGVADRAHFLDSRADVLPVYDALDAFVMTSDSETIGTVTRSAGPRGPSSGPMPVERLSFGPTRPAGAAAERGGHGPSRCRFDEAAPEALADRTRKGRDYAAKCRPSQLIPAWEELLASLVESGRKA